MSKKPKSKKDMYGSAVKRSEYNDEILRNNRRTDNRLKMDMHYYDRAQKVIMKDLGKESSLLQNKLDSDRKTLSFGLYGSKIGVNGTKNPSRYTPTSPTGHMATPNTFRTGTFRSNSRTSQFPWDRDATDKESTLVDSSVAGSSASHARSKLPSASSYLANRGTADDFLASILSEAMNDELMYTQRSGVDSISPQKSSATPVSSRPPTKKIHKTPRSRMVPSDSIVNALANAAPEADEVIY